MKNVWKYLLPVLLLSLAVLPIRAENNNMARLKALVREVRSEENVDVVDIGPVGMRMIRTLAKASAKTPEDRQALRFLKGIKGIMVVDFEDMEEDRARRRFADKLEKALAGREKFMEAKNDGETVRIYATLDEKSGMLEDLVIFGDPGTLVCLYGKVPLDMLGEMMKGK